MEKKITIEYNWRNSEGTPIKANHQEALEESAMEHIFEMMSEGYRSGELFTTVLMDDEDGIDGIEYSGWFNISTETL